MSVQTLERPGQREPTHTSLERNPPPLESGDRLSLPEFERRYHAQPEIKKAELIEGIVYVASTVSARLHGDPHFDVIAWLGLYRAMTPNLRGSDNATLRLDLQNEPQPDALLRLPESVGGKSYIAADGYLEGAPELIVEVASSSASYDLNQKKRVYARNQVPEYIVFETYEQQVHWFALRQGSYEAQQVDQVGILKSQVLPGLWLHPAAFWAGDMAAVFAVLNQGLASAEHAAFVDALTVKQK